MSGDLAKLKTWTGLPAGEVAERLREPFEDAQAYKAIQGGAAGAARLTDIDTAWMIERVNEVFGPYGLGWTLDWRVEDVILMGEDPKRMMVAVKRAEFRYVLIDESGQERVCVAPCCGGSHNELPFALKGMETSCIGNALSKLRYQELVYKGLLTHENASGRIGQRKDRSDGKERSGGSEVRKTVPSAGDPEAGVLAGGGSGSAGGDFVIPLGKHRGKKLSEVDLQLVEWYASKMRATTEAARQLQAQSRAHLEMQAPAG